MLYAKHVSFLEAEEKAAKKAAKEEQKRQREEEKTQKKLQRDLKAQRSLQQNESRLFDSSSGDVAEGTPDSAKETTKVPGPDSLVQPTPDYAAELFDGAIPSARPAPSAPAQPAPAPGSIPTSIFASANAGPSTIISPPSESHTAAAALSSNLGPSDASANGVTPSTPFFFAPSTPAAAKKTPTTPIAAAADDGAPTVVFSPDRPKSSRKGSSAKTAKATNASATPKPTSRAKKRKGEAAADTVSDVGSSPVQQQQRPAVVMSIGQPVTGISAQPLVQHIQQPQLVRFQYGGMTATAATSSVPQAAGRGLAQMAQNIFASQQQAAQQQQQATFPLISQVVQQPGQQQQMSAPKTIVFVQQAAQGGQVPATVGFFNPTPSTSVVVRPQQPMQTATVPAQMLASFTPSVIRQSSEAAGATGITIPAQAPNATSVLRPTTPTSAQQLVVQQPAGTSDGESKKPTFTITVRRFMLLLLLVV